MPLQTLRFNLHRAPSIVKHSNEQGIHRVTATRWRLGSLPTNCLRKRSRLGDVHGMAGRWKKKRERERERTGSDGTEESRPVRLTECHNSDSAGSVKNVCTRDRERNNCAGPSLGSLRNYRRGIYPATGGTDRCYQFIRGSQPMAARLMTF